MDSARSSGVLCHPTSLPGAGPIGTLGAEAFAFIDFLAAANQNLWQILPLSPTGLDGSPYNARSAMAGNPRLINLEWLVTQGLLPEEDLPWRNAPESDAVDFAAAEAGTEAALRAAFNRFQASAPGDLKSGLAAFRHSERTWLDDYALFEALRCVHDNAPWYEWDEPLRRRDARALDRQRRAHAAEIDFQVFTQFLFQQQWSAMRAYANRRGIRIIGDIPIYVALDSADVWANQALFELDAAGKPTVVAGVPPDLFSKTGQLWGNPCYRWSAMAADGYGWWIERVQRTLAHCDVVRLDHFRGFAAGWQVPAGEETAVAGRWVSGPGQDFFEQVARKLGPLPLIVEDLGVITEDVAALRIELGFPGMKVLQFAFDGDPSNSYLPHNFEPNCVVYTGTHDNDTTISWYAALEPAQRDQVDRYLGPHDPDPAWALMRLAQASVARLAIAPLQDVLSLGQEARMNRPGTGTGNWRWRFRQGDLAPTLARRLAALSETYGRVSTG